MERHAVWKLRLYEIFILVVMTVALIEGAVRV